MIAMQPNPTPQPRKHQKSQSRQKHARFPTAHLASNRRRNSKNLSACRKMTTPSSPARARLAGQTSSPGVFHYKCQHGETHTCPVPRILPHEYRCRPNWIHGTHTHLHRPRHSYPDVRAVLSSLERAPISTTPHYRTHPPLTLRPQSHRRGSRYPRGNHAPTRFYRSRQM